MARKVKLFFATDVHGSEQCFRKFLNAGAAYAPDVMVLGGDVAGKAVQAVVRARRRPLPVHASAAASTTSTDGDELRRVERLIADNGYYPWRCGAGRARRARWRTGRSTRCCST